MDTEFEDDLRAGKPLDIKDDNDLWGPTRRYLNDPALVRGMRNAGPGQLINCVPPFPTTTMWVDEADSLMKQYSRKDMRNLMEHVFRNEINKLREEGQKEYAHKDGNAFANFERTGAELEIPREKVLWTFAMKHKDGIAAYINGHKSQREDVRGRINDLIVYLFLLRGMVDENEGVFYDAQGNDTGPE